LTARSVPFKQRGRLTALLEPNSRLHIERRGEREGKRGEEERERGGEGDREKEGEGEREREGEREKETVRKINQKWWTKLARINMRNPFPSLVSSLLVFLFLVQQWEDCPTTHHTHTPQHTTT